MLDERIHIWEKEGGKGKYVLYRMQASVRYNHNLALNYAVEEANKRDLPLKILFTLHSGFPDANYRHYLFLCQGLFDFAAKAIHLGYDLIVETDPDDDRIRHYLHHADLVILDKGYLRIQRQWADFIIQYSPATVVMIEDNLLVPVSACTNKQEWAARTIRPKIMKHYLYFLSDMVFDRPAPLNQHLFSAFTFAKIEDKLNYFLQKLTPGTMPLLNRRGGEEEALKCWSLFLNEKFLHYASDRNDPSLHATSGISPYLHFGQISSSGMLRAMYDFLQDRADAHLYEESRDVLIEQLIVRRELAHNYVWFNPDYDHYNGLPQWCRDTLGSHQRDEREYLYSPDELESAQTHDPYWNRAMAEMIQTGSMENTMRMYWGKKILEWSPSPEEAYYTALRLNNKYFLDGRDANSYVGVGWCFGLHDRPWTDRPVFGMIRYMNAAGLERKYKIKEY
ncbi:MAG: deoxyribodipyrimidine photo-lyase [Bacteroidales bacterium]